MAEFKGFDTYAHGDKNKYFHRGGENWCLPANKEVAAKWRREYELCSCANCNDMTCDVRFKKERFPLDVEGGRMQCANLVADNPFAFRNPDGTIVIIPEKVVSAIIDRVFEEMEE